MKPSVIVWDLETVPDLGGFAAANDLVGKSDVEVREAIGDKFPKHTYHSIVCIGALIAHWEPDHGAVDAVSARRREWGIAGLSHVQSFLDLPSRIMLQGRAADWRVNSRGERELRRICQLLSRGRASRGGH